MTEACPHSVNDESVSGYHATAGGRGAPTAKEGSYAEAERCWCAWRAIGFCTPVGPGYLDGVFHVVLSVSLRDAAVIG